jgi:ATP-dependent helicase HrpA
MDFMLLFLGQRRSADQKLQVYLLRELFGIEQASPPLAAHFQRTVTRLQGRLAAIGQQLLAEVLELVRERHAASLLLLRYARMSADNAAVRGRLQLLQKELDDLAPDDILAAYTRLRIVQLPRYLKALQRRTDRAYAAPEKDLAKAEHLVAHEQRYQAMKASLTARPNPEALRILDDFRWLLEEYKVSLFAPEIKTALRISSKVLDAKWQEGMPWR